MTKFARMARVIEISFSFTTFVLYLWEESKKGIFQIFVRTKDALLSRFKAVWQRNKLWTRTNG
jgi:hypothetical protein